MSDYSDDYVAELIDTCEAFGIEVPDGHKETDDIEELEDRLIDLYESGAPEAAAALEDLGWEPMW